MISSVSVCMLYRPPWSPSKLLLPAKVYCKASGVVLNSYCKVGQHARGIVETIWLWPILT